MLVYDGVVSVVLQWTLLQADTLGLSAVLLLGDTQVQMLFIISFMVACVISGVHDLHNGNCKL